MRTIFLISFLLISSVSHAIVNIEKVTLGDAEKEFQGDVSLKLSDVGGNTNKEAINFGNRLQWDNIYTQFVVLKYEYEETSDVANTDKTFLHYRYIHRGQDSSTWEVFAQVENDEFKSLKLRSLLGAGMRYLVHKNKDQSLARVGVGLFSSREEYDDAALTIEELVRANLYFTFQYKVKKDISFLTTTYYQPDIKNEHDYRALEQLSLQFYLSGGFVYFMNIDASYDNEPVGSVEKYDSSFTTGIKYKF